ncbi:hypothetical protein [Zavarzinia sp. CC-PAN008]|uniref:hypothetical protein n=1 Tax=Zavarzinia sp. CC-PAN008 TaxID=3243332 RepID=UPI003F7483BF
MTAARAPTSRTTPIAPAAGWEAALLALSLLVLYLPTARFVAKHAWIGPGGVLAAGFVLACGGIAWMLLRRRPPATFSRMVASPWPTLALLCLAGTVALVLYPVADALKLQGRGSDQDDCVIAGVERLLRGLPPYGERTYLDNPCSPLPGMFALYAPFVMLNLYALGAVTALAAVAATLRARTGDWQVPGVFLLLLLSSAANWELMIAGTDLILLGCGFALLALLLPDVARAHRWMPLLELAVFCGLCASSRLNFLPLGAMFGLFVGFTWPRGGLAFLAVATLVALVPGVLIHAWDPAGFTPFHLIVKSERILGATRPYAAGLALAVALGACILLRRGRLEMRTAAFLCLVTPLLTLTLMELARRRGDLRAWDGVSYLLPVIPLACINAAFFWRARLRRPDGTTGSSHAA